MLVSKYQLDVVKPEEERLQRKVDEFIKNGSLRQDSDDDEMPVICEENPSYFLWLIK